MKKPISKAVYILLAMGVLISGPRFSGAFAAAIGIDLFRLSPIFGYVEIGSGWALAFFESLAIAYIASRFRHIQIISDDDSLPLRKRVLPANAVYWGILFLGQAFLLFTIPVVSTVHLATQAFRLRNGSAAGIQDILTFQHIYEHFLVWLWLFLTAAASTLFVFLLGLVIDDFGILHKDRNTKLYNAYTDLKQTVPIVDPQTLAAKTGVTVKEAADFLDDLNPATPMPDYKARLDDLRRRQNGA